jgi:predicted metalloprotease with PDZ domain
MSRRIALWTLVLAVALALPLSAGEGHKKCEGDAQACLNKMAAKFKDRGWVGVELDHNKDGSMTVLEVIDGSPAQAAGLNSGDVLLAINGVKFGDKNSEKLKATQKDMRIGNTITYTVKRYDKTKDVPITLAPIPEEVMYAWVGQHMMNGHMTVEIASK